MSSVGLRDEGAYKGGYRSLDEDLDVVRKVKIIKMDGRIERFNVEKLVKSILKAFRAAGLSLKWVDEVVADVIGDIAKKCKDSKESCEVSYREVYDLVEKAMMSRIVKDYRFSEAVKRYALARIYQDVYGKDRWDGSFDSRDLKLTYPAIKVLEARYLIKDPNTLRYTETPQMLFRRVARSIAEVEKRYGASDEEIRKIEEEFYELLSSLRFLPNTPTLMNAGTDNGLLSACFVIPVRDSLTTPDGEGIMDALRAQAIIQKLAGGTGFSFSELRPEGDVVASTSGVASGPLSFMRLFDVNTDVIKQGGKRRGANMGILHVWHPDIEKFILSKTGQLKDVHLQNFNISVGVNDAFLEAVDKGEKFPLINPRKTQLRPGSGDSRYYAVVRARFSIKEEWVQEQILSELEENGGSVPLDESKIITWEEALAIAEREGAIVRWIDARKLWNKIVYGAWDSGDPGLVFIDTINRTEPSWYFGKINATNPCSESPLLDWEPCNLGSLDLSKYVVTVNGEAKLDLDRLKRDIYTAIRFLDNVIDAAKWILPQLERGAKLTRKIGLGVMGWAHALIKLGIRYDSPDAIYLAWYLARFIYYHSMKASIELAKVRGAFPVFNPKLFRPTWMHAKDVREIFEIAGIEFKVSEKARKLVSELEVDFSELEHDIARYGVRNARVLSIAPTGTISIIAGTSSSIEPIFALAFIRSVAVGTFIELDPLFLDALKRYELDSPELIELIAETGSIAHNPYMPRTLRELFRTAHDVSYIYHLLHQASWQQWIDAGVSKTINMPSEASISDVENSYKLAWKLGIKGTTVYRDKSKSRQVIYFGLKSSEKHRKSREGASADTYSEEGDKTYSGDEVEQAKTRSRREVANNKIRIKNKEYIAVEGYTDPSCKTCEF